MTHHTHYLTMGKNKRKLHVIILKNLRINIMNVNQKGLKMNMKKTTLASAILLSLMLTGCGSSSSSGGTPEITVPDLSSTEITALVEAAGLTQALADAGLTADDLVDYISAEDDTAEEIQAVIDEVLAAADAEKYVVLTDESTSQNAQLVYTLPAAQATGKVTAKIKVDSADAKLSYITLFGATGSVKTSPLDLKIGGSHADAYGTEAADGESIIYSRNDGGDDILTALTLTTNTWVNISLEWDKDADTVDIIISDLEGTELSSDTLAFQSSVDVTKVAFQVSDSSNVTTTDEPIAVDDFMVYDTDLTTVLHTDDFSGDLSAYSSRGADIII